MSSLEQAIETVRRVHQKLGTVKFALAAGLPYTTVNDCRRRDFVGPAVETLLKLSAAAEEIERAESRGRAA